MLRLAITLLLLFVASAHAESWDPAAPDYTGRQGLTIHVSKLGDNTDGLSWATAYTTVQAALDHVPDAQGGHRVFIRPDTYMEPNLTVPHPGAEGSYNLLIGDTDGSLGSGHAGEVVLDAGDPEKGFKSYDWWGSIRSNQQGWSKEHTEPTFSAIVWDRWILRNLYATGGDAGLFWDCTNRIEPFSIVVEDCTSIGRAFGGGVASCLSRPDEPITFRRCTLWSLDWWGDTAGLYVRVENPTMPKRPDVLVQDCTLVSPQCALKGGNYGFHTFMRVQTERSKLITLNFSQPVGTPTDGIIQSVENGKYLHVDLADTTLMGYKVFGVKVEQDTAGDIGYTATGAVNAYVQHSQDVPAGMLRLGHWPTDVFANLTPPAPADTRPSLGNETLVRKDMCEVTPIVWKGRLCLFTCIRPASGGTREDYHLALRDAETDEELARFATGYSLGSAFVQGDTFYATASRFENDNWNDVTLFSSRDLKEWKQERIIEQEPNEHLFNSSVCVGPNGFVLAYESNTPDYPAFTVKFAESKDLNDWRVRTDAVFGTNRYTACPTIRYADGYYYLLYLEHRTPRWFFETNIARSTDLVSWEQSPLNPVLSPTSIDDGINASDPDLAEHNGNTLLYYAVGDQRTWMNIKRRTHPAPMNDFLAAWFPNGGIPEPGDLGPKPAPVANNNPNWFNDTKFGLFIHWGPFAEQGNDPDAAYDYFDMKQDKALRADYPRYAKAFAPKKFNPQSWMQLATDAGMRYVVFTTKHHDGYALFDSALTEYDSVDSAPHADFTKGVADAARAANLKLGFYYSMLDWHHPDYEPDLPKYIDEYLFGQVRELCTNYGPVDCLWFDGEWDYPEETWRAYELATMIRSLQPGALINDRTGKGVRGLTPLADFYTREQPSEVNATTHFEREKPYAWEACVTMNESWQYMAKDQDYKSDAELIRLLVDVVSRGGNLLLNVGPTPDGDIPAPQQERLHAMGDWLRVNGESIYGAGASPFAALPVGKCTTKGNRLYLHLEAAPGEPLALPGLQNEITKAWLLDGGTALEVDNTGKQIVLPKHLPDAHLTTIAVELDGPPMVQ
jgi:alpha-L-fucosidase